MQLMKCFFCKVKQILKTVFQSKTDVFLLSYVLFLICALFLYPFWSQAFAHKMIAAISVSGALISLAELCYTIRSIKNERLHQSCELLRLSVKAIKELLQERKRMVDEIDKKICVHFTSKENISEQEKEMLLQKYSEQMDFAANAKEKYQTDYENAQTTITNIQNGISTMKEKASKTSISGNIFMVFGILSFLIITSLDNTGFLTMLSPYLTILAFALLMVNYFVKQICSSNNKIDLDALREQYDK